MGRRCPGDGESIRLQFALMLRGGAVNSLHEAPRQPFALTSSSRHRRCDLRSSLLSPRAALDGATLVLARHFQSRPCFKRSSESSPKKRCSSSPSCSSTYNLPTRQRSPRSQNRVDAETTLRTTWIFCIGFVSITLRPEGAASSFQKLLSYQADGIEVHKFFFFEFSSSVE